VIRLTLLIFALLAPAAWAQDDGVFVDPDSPTGKEYAIPLEEARRQADPSSGGGQKVQPGTRDSPLFGEGIEEEEEDDGSSAGGGSPSGGGGGGGGSSSQPEATATPAPEAREAIERATNNPGAPGDGSPLLLILGGAALVLVVGGAAGYAFRRNPASSPPQTP
jgi:hypothetical protein